MPQFYKLIICALIATPVVATAQPKIVVDCSFETNDARYVVGVLEDNGQYFASVEEIWGEGEEYDSDEMTMTLSPNGTYRQEGKSEYGLVTNLKITPENKSAYISMDSTPADKTPISFKASCY